MQSKIMALMLIIATMGLAGTSCTKKAQVGNMLRQAIKDDVKTLDPANAYDSVSWTVLPNIYDTLLQYKYLGKQLELEPLLADGMPIFSKDGLTVTIKIKKGILFQDDAAFKATQGKGRELKASDFIFAFKRLAIPAIQSQGAWIFDGKVVGFSEFGKKLQGLKGEEFKKAFAEAIPGITAKDDYTIELKLTGPYPTLNYILAMYFTSPVPVEAIEAYADQDGNLRDHPIGTGPFILKSWETNQKVVLVKNPNYKGTYPSTTDSEELKAKGFLADAGKPLPFVDQLEFHIIKEDQPRLLNFQKSELDLFELTKDSFRASMETGAKVKDDLAKLGVVPEYENALIMYYVGFNMKDKTLQNKYLRQALSAAIDREKYIETFQKFVGTKQTQVCPPGVADRADGNNIKYDFDLTQAKELLAKAGFPEGKGLPVLNFDFRGADTLSRQMGEFFVQQFGAIGVKVNVVLNTFPAYLEKAKQGNLQIFYGGWNMDYPDVENGYQLLYGPNKAPGPNDTNWENPQYDALYKKMSALAANVKGRKDVVTQMEGIIQEEVPWAYLFYKKVYWLRQSWVKNFRPSETIQNKYQYIKIERTESK